MSDNIKLNRILSINKDSSKEDNTSLLPTVLTQAKKTKLDQMSSIISTSN